MLQPDRLRQLVYVSAATAPFDAASLRDLLLRSRATNARLRISGMLLYHDGSFLQVLEGPETSVATIFEKISLDDRHEDLAVLLQRPVGARSFEPWSMGLVAADAAALQGAAGLSDFLDEGLPRLAGRPDRALTLLEGFRSGLWRQAIR
jgi:hypothetical protein